MHSFSVFPDTRDAALTGVFGLTPLPMMEMMWDATGCPLHFMAGLRYDDCKKHIERV
jgi:hypothetical protein